MTLWTHQDAAKATGGTASGAWDASRVVIDSRIVRAGDLFVALKGDAFDGHDFVKDALAKGAVAAVVSHVPQGVAESQLLQVKDTLQALQNLAAFARTRTQAKIIGVTGSVGKTGAKEALRKEVGRLAVAGAEKILMREIDAKRNSVLIDNLIEEI